MKKADNYATLLNGAKTNSEFLIIAKFADNESIEIEFYDPMTYTLKFSDESILKIREFKRKGEVVLSHD